MLNHLGSNDINAANKLGYLHMLVGDWAVSTLYVLKLKQDGANTTPDGRRSSGWYSAMMDVEGREARIKVFCPDMRIPDYTK